MLRKIPQSRKYHLKLDLGPLHEKLKLNEPLDDFDEAAKKEFALKDAEINGILAEINVVLDNLNYGAQNIGLVNHNLEYLH